MVAGRPSIMTLTGGASSLVQAVTSVFQPDLAVTPISITIQSVMNSTAATPSYTVYWTNDTPAVITPSSSSATVFSLNSTGYTGPTWFSSGSSNLSSNSFITFTLPVRGITIGATAGSTNQTITTTIVQAG